MTMKINARGFVLLAVIAAATIGAVRRGVAEVAYSPRSNKIVVWEPFAWQLPTAAADNVIKRTTDAQKQGYVVHRRSQDTAPGDGSWGTCDPAAFHLMAARSGIAIVVAHAYFEGSFCAVAFEGGEKDKRAKKLAHDWQHGLLRKKGTKVEWAQWVNPDLDAWVVSASPEWIAENWQAGFKDSRTIVAMIVCGSSDLLSPLGARLRLGYEDCPLSYAEDMDILFGRMNGQLEKGTCRRSEQAMGKGGFPDKGFVHKQDGSTTLCPSVEDTVGATYHFFPWGSGAGYSGTGYVVFDTHLHTEGVNAKDALVAEVLAGSVLVDNFAWAGDNKITFTYKALDCNPYQVMMYAKGAVIKAEGGTELKLDGGEAGAGGEGIAPNEDDFKWGFQR
jgi:hypothetical protein